MFSRAVVQFQPKCGPVRQMATLKAIQMRLKAVTNIQKITKSMKMVSAAKYARADRDLKLARPFGLGTQAFFEKAEITSDDQKPNHFALAMSSDRGLCGGIHSSVCKAIRADIAEKPPGITTKIICIGDKARGILNRFFKDDILMHFVDYGKRPPTFSDASIVANNILNLGYEYDHGQLYYNFFRSVVSYRTLRQPLFNLDQVSTAEKITDYDSLDEDVLRNYNEFALASLIYYAMKEAACSEQSSRMTSMEAASKNAGEMIDKLALLYNRTRQAVITRELIEIISGAAALK